MSSHKNRIDWKTVAWGLGPQDQHAQLQRWLAGLQNVGVIFLNLQSTRVDKEFCVQPAESPVPFLNKYTGGKIIEAQIEGTEVALNNAGVKTYKIIMNSIDEKELGAFLMS